MAGERPKIAVFGAGLVGAFIGARLAVQAEVTLVGRPAMLEPMAGGVRVTDVDGLDIEAGGFRTETEPEALVGAELVLVTVKSQATGDAADAIGCHAPADALVVSFQNGVSNAARLREAAGERVVLAGMVPFNIAQLGPAHLHRGTAGGLVVEAHASFAPFAPLFAAAGLPVVESAAMEGVLWGKLLVNLNNAINALSGVSLMEQLRQRDFRRAWALSLDEGLKTVRAAGIAPVDPLPMPLALMPQILRLPDPLYRYVVVAGSGGRARVDPHARSSMADDLARGRRTEIDALQGEVVALAERLGRKAAVNARLVELVRAAEAGAEPWGAGALYKELLAARG
jgi:2-dehydropantoate 2-reductase